MAAETKAPVASALPKAVSFFGAGLMGRPMIERFLNAGYTVCAWNRTVNKLEELASKYPANQLQLFSDPADCFQRNAVSIIMLAEYQPINHVLTSIVAGCPNFKGKTVINTSTISSDESHLLSNKVREAGGIYISAPVLGSVPVAAAGKLAILFSSDDPWQFDKYAEFLSPIGQAKFIGPTGSSATMKLALNQVLAAQVAGYAFSMAFVEKAGLDPKVFQELLQAGPFRSPYFDLKFDNMNNRQFTPVNFPTQLMLKDVDLILAEADKLGLTTSSVDGVKSLLQRTIERGFGRDDFSSVFNGVLPSSESSAGRTPHNYNTHLM